jgi:hypothetical protein
MKRFGSSRWNGGLREGKGAVSTERMHCRQRSQCSVVDHDQDLREALSWMPERRMMERARMSM